MSFVDDEIVLETYHPRTSKKPKKLRYKTAKEYLVYLVNYKDYSKSELFQKSRSKGYDEKEIEIVINRFEELGLINDDRLRARIIEKYQDKKPPQWIKNKLWTRGLLS